jgi:hypothetical protein
MTSAHHTLRHVGLRHGAAANEPKHDTDRADRPPVGYRLVDDPMYRISLRDLVFVGGRQASWRSARRAGELGSFRRDSAAMAVAVLAA